MICFRYWNPKYVSPFWGRWVFQTWKFKGCFGVRILGLEIEWVEPFGV